MARVLTPSLKTAKPFLVIKKRSLPIEGSVLVRKGEKVEARQIVAEASLAGDLVIVRTAEQLGLHPEEALKAFLVREGDKVKKGDVLCEHKALFGLLKSRILSPADGTVEFISKETAHLGIRLLPKKITLNAFIAGEVLSVEERRAVEICSYSAYIQGIFGVGGESIGMLKVVEEREELNNINLKGQILVVKDKITKELVNRCTAQGVAGLIGASAEYRLVADYAGKEIGVAVTGNEDVAFPLILTEGFGTLIMREHAWSILKSLNGKECSISGATQIRAGAQRPEIIIPLKNGRNYVNLKSESQELVVGTQVRIIRNPWFGEIGTVVELPQEPELIPTGAKCRVLRCKLKSGKIVTVPRANIELV